MQSSNWQYRILGRTGVRVSPLCLGTFNFGGPTPAAEAQTMIDHAELVDSALQYAILEAASHTAVAGRDLELAMEAVQKLVERFETDGYQLRADLLREFGRPSSASRPGADLLKQELLLLLDEVTQQGRQDVAPEVLEMVAALAERWRDADLQEAWDKHRE